MKGHSVDFFVQKKDLIEDYSIIKPTLIDQQKNKALQTLKLYKLIKSISPDISIIRFPNGFFALSSIIFSKICGSKIILYQQIESNKINEIFEEKSNLLSRIRYLFLFKLFQACLMTPLRNQNSNESKIRKNIYYVPFAIENSDRSYEFKKKKRILSIGKFQIRKRHLLSLKVLNNLKEILDFHYTIVGEISTIEHRKYFMEIFDYIKKFNLDNNVTIFANIPYNQISNFYKDSDIYLLSSTEEPAAISPLEALGYGLVNICTNQCGTTTYFKHMKNALIFDPNNENELSEMIKKLTLNENLFKEIFFNTKKSKDEISNENFYKYFHAMIKDKFKINE